MGSIISQQGCLKLSKKQGLVEKKKIKKGKTYKFKKEGHRLYMLDTPMDLITDKWEFVAKILMLEFTVGRGRTEGSYRVIKVFSEEEARAISKSLIPYYKFRK